MTGDLMRPCLCFVVLLLCFAFSAVAVPPEGQIKERVLALFGPLAGEDPHLTMGIVVGVVTPGGRSHFEFGKASGADATKALNENTLFELGSVAKVFTTTLLADAVVRGKAKLADTYQSCKPTETSALCFQGKSIQLVHLATHTAGFPFMPENADALLINPLNSYGMPQLNEFFAKFRLRRAPGEKFVYSNLGVGLLGVWLSQKQNLTYEKLLRSRLTGPLDMTDTTSQLTDDQRHRRADGYAMQGRLRTPVPSYELGDSSVFTGAVGIDSSVHDMLQWVAANLGLVATPLKSAFSLAQTAKWGTSDHRIGLGWNLQGDAIFHFGYTPGYRAFAAFRPDKKVGVVVLSNTVTEDSRFDEACWFLLQFLGN